MDREIRVLCDGKPIPLVPFVETLIADTVTAMVRGLKGAEEARDITIVIKNADR